MASYELHKILNNPTTSTVWESSFNEDGTTLVIGETVIGNTSFPGSFYAYSISYSPEGQIVSIAPKGSLITGSSNEKLGRVVGINTTGDQIVISSDVSLFKIYSYSSNAWNQIFDTGVTVSPTPTYQLVYDSEFRYIVGNSGTDVFFYRYDGSTWTIPVNTLSPDIQNLLVDLVSFDISDSNVIAPITDPIFIVSSTDGRIRLVDLTIGSTVTFPEITKYYNDNDYLVTRVGINRAGTHVAVSYIYNLTYFVDVFRLNATVWDLQNTFSFGTVAGFAGVIDVTFGGTLVENRIKTFSFDIYPPSGLINAVSNQTVYGIYEYNGTGYSQTLSFITKLQAAGASDANIGAKVMAMSYDFKRSSIPFFTTTVMNAISTQGITGIGGFNMAGQSLAIFSNSNAVGIGDIVEIGDDGEAIESTVPPVVVVPTPTTISTFQRTVVVIATFMTIAFAFWFFFM